MAHIRWNWIRDYIHVMDVAEGHLAALEYLISKKSDIISLNLGTGKGTSVLELVKMFEQINRVMYLMNS